MIKNHPLKVLKVTYYMYRTTSQTFYILFIFDYNYFIRKCSGKRFSVYNTLILEHPPRQEVADDADT